MPLEIPKLKQLIKALPDPERRVEFLAGLEGKTQIDVQSLFECLSPSLAEKLLDDITELVDLASGKKGTGPEQYQATLEAKRTIHSRLTYTSDPYTKGDLHKEFIVHLDSTKPPDGAKYDSVYALHATWLIQTLACQDDWINKIRDRLWQT